MASPVDQSTVEDGNDVAFIEVIDCFPPTYIANNYGNKTYFICSLATWGKYKGNTQSINLLLSPLKFYSITLHTLYKVSCQDLFIIVICLQKAVIC